MKTPQPLVVFAAGALSCLFLSTDGVCLLALVARMYDDAPFSPTPFLQLAAPLALAYSLSKMF